MAREFPMSMQACTIAVIDDDSRVLESLVNLLSSFGYSAQIYQSGGTISYIRYSLSDRLHNSTDVEMQQMSGLGLLQFPGKASTALCL